jgi:hypothetical protein
MTASFYLKRVDILALCGFACFVADPFFVLYSFCNNAPAEDKEIGCERKGPGTRDGLSVNSVSDGRIEEGAWYKQAFLAP